MLQTKRCLRFKRRLRTYCGKCRLDATVGSTGRGLQLAVKRETPAVERDFGYNRLSYGATTTCTLLGEEATAAVALLIVANRAERANTDQLDRLLEHATTGDRHSYVD